jgi:Uma2 family endonuclease
MLDMEATVPKTALDIYRMLPEGTRCEVIENVLYMCTFPTERHQLIAFLLASEIHQHVQKLARTYCPCPDVYFEDQLSAFVPDVLVLMKSRLDIIKNGSIYGPPDVVIEILSRESERDEVMKKDVYEKAGIKEYFLVDQDNLNTTCWKLNMDGYYMRTYADVPGYFNSSELGIEFQFDCE